MRRIFLGVLLMLAALGCGQRREHVVLYTSQDQFYAEPILARFTKETGIEVRAVFDTESVKTAALARRLRAERNNPQCDLFWSNEELHSRMLMGEGVVSDRRSVGFRTREMVVNTNLLNLADAPKTLLALTEPKWKNKVALAYPLFGTTSIHFLALRQYLGDVAWRDWCAKLVANGARVVDGNSVVVRLVGSGECAIGLTDSDDIAAGQRQGLPVAEAADFEETLVIANTISLVKGAPRPDAARALGVFLEETTTLQKLVELGAISGIRPGSDVRSLAIDWSNPLASLDDMNEILEKVFLRL